MNLSTFISDPVQFLLEHNALHLSCYQSSMEKQLEIIINGLDLFGFTE